MGYLNQDKKKGRFKTRPLYFLLTLHIIEKVFLDNFSILNFVHPNF